MGFSLSNQHTTWRCSLTGQEQISHARLAPSGWLALWAAQVPGKVKIHVWRLIQNGLAVGNELQCRKIKEGVLCLVCNREESLLHHFWHCPHSTATWEIARSQMGLSLSSPDSLVRRHPELHAWLDVGLVGEPRGEGARCCNHDHLSAVASKETRPGIRLWWIRTRRLCGILSTCWKSGWMFDDPQV
jgi:hypothetical protein